MTLSIFCKCICNLHRSNCTGPEQLLKICRCQTSKILIFNPLTLSNWKQIHNFGYKNTPLKILKVPGTCATCFNTSLLEWIFWKKVDKMIVLTKSIWRKCNLLITDIESNCEIQIMILNKSIVFKIPISNGC